MRRIPLREALDALEAHYGAPKRPRLTDPFEQVLFENASYLVDDRTRAEVFASLKKRVGTTPARILAAKQSALRSAIRDGGMLPPMRAAKLTRAANLATELGVPLARVVRRPWREAKKVLKCFPGIAEAGAERVALFAGAQPLLGLESNGLRVLVRLGFGREHPGWDRTWKEASAAAQAELPNDVRAVQRAHLLLRRHGQELCKRHHPRCAECPLARRCPEAESVGRSAG